MMRAPFWFAVGLAIPLGASILFELGARLIERLS